MVNADFTVKIGGEVYSWARKGAREEMRLLSFLRAFLALIQWSTA